MKGVLRRGVSALCALFLVLGTAACQQKEPKMKDGKILLTVCMESSVGLPNAEKGTTMENSIQSIAQYYTASVNPDVTFEFVTLTADQEERSNRIDQLQTEMMAGQGPDIFILPCDDGFGFNETRLIENVEKGMVTGLFADLSQLYDQDETFDLLERRGKLSLVRVPGQPLHGEPAPAICLLRAVLAAAGAVLFLLRRRCVGQWDSQGGEGMKPVILKVSFALLLVLALCTVASYHIERIMMAKV